MGVGNMMTTRWRIGVLGITVVLVVLVVVGSVELAMKEEVFRVRVVPDYDFASAPASTVGRESR